MKKYILAVGLGLLTPFMFILGAEPFEVRGRNSVAEVAAGCLAATLYLAACQYGVARRAGQGTGVRWSTVVAMGAPVAAWVVVMAAVEKPATVLAQGLPMLLAGAIGVVAGALLAARRKQ